MKHKKPTEAQQAVAAVRAMPRLRRTDVVVSYLIQNPEAHGRSLRRTLGITGRQFRKALRTAKSIASTHNTQTQ